MRTVNLYEAKTHLSHLVEVAAAGELVVIGKGGTPMVMMVPYVATAGEARTPGLWRGRVRIAADFDEVPEEFADYLPSSELPEAQRPER